MAESREWRYPLQCWRSRALAPALTCARIADRNPAEAHGEEAEHDRLVCGRGRIRQLQLRLRLPRQFERRPTQGHCRGFEVVRIDRVTSVMFRWTASHALTYAWPGAIFEGGGAMQAVIDERADERQREALVTVVHGGETEEAKTHWWVFHAMSSTVHPALFRPIDRGGHREAAARVVIPGVLEARADRL